jgi:hypothetical protein
MTQPPDEQNRDPRPPESLLAEAVEQAADTARTLLDGLKRFAKSEADALADREYGLANVATAPVRLFQVLVSSAFDAASTVSDNLALLSLDGRPTTPEPRTVPVYVGKPAHPGVVTFTTSDLVGELPKHRIPSGQIAVTTEWLADGVATVVVRSGSAPPDIYAGNLFMTDSTTSEKTEFPFLVAITELGIPLT